MKITIELKYEESIFYRHRSRFNELLHKGTSTTKEAASLFYYLNRTAYNGLCRFNRSGEFNVPFGKYRTINYKRDFAVYRSAFADWEFSNLSFDRLKLRADDFVYADPPYDVEFTQYAQGGFTWDDQERTAESLARPGVGSVWSRTRCSEIRNCATSTRSGRTRRDAGSCPHRVPMPICARCLWMRKS